MKNVFDAAICLCLDKRKEHWKDLQKQAEELDIPFIPFVCGDGSDKELVYDSIDVVNPDVSRWGYGVEGLKHHHWNALYSHKKMIQLARERGYKKVLMLEDDAYIVSRYTEVLQSLSPQENEVLEMSDIVAYGWWHTADDSPFNKAVEDDWKENKQGRLLRVRPDIRVGGLHATILDENVYDFVLNAPFVNPLDSQLCDASNKFIYHLVTPKIIHVKSIHSFTEGCTFERAKL